jgi:selenocysteine lyase/cysteine desulfurase
VLAVSHVHWRTGTRLDLVRLAAACRTTDCRLIVDGAHGIGAVSVDASAVDAYCAPTFKWLLSGFGLGILALSDRLASELVPALRGYGNTPPSRSLEYGHVNYPGVYALRATLGYLRALGWSGIHWRVDALASMLAANIRARGFEVLTPDSAHAGIVAIRHDDAPALVRALAERSIHVEARDGVVRVAAHFYNTSAEIHAFADTLDALCGDRRRTP